MTLFDPLELTPRLGEAWKCIDTMDFRRDDVFRFVHNETEPVILAVIPVPSPCLAIYGNVVVALSDRVIRRALERMDFWTGLEGPSLGLRPESNEITMTEVVPLTDAALKALPQTLDAFIAELQSVRAELEALQAEHVETPSGVKV